MKTLLLIALMLCALAVPARADMLLGGVARPCPGNDGSSGIVAGNAAQQPTLLSGYARTLHELGCHVAGVDYAVGPKPGTVFRDPATCACLPANATYTTNYPLSGVNSIVVNGTSPTVVLDSLDMTLHNGVMLYVSLGSGTGNVTLTNSKLQAPTLGGDSAACCIHVATGGAAVNLTIQYDDISGGGGGNAGSVTNSAGEVAIYKTVSGTDNVSYNYLHNLPSDVYVVAAGNQTVTYKYNLIYDNFKNPGEHANVVTFNGEGVIAADAEFNTIAVFLNGAPGGELFQWYNQSTSGGVFTSVTQAYNTQLSLATVTSFVTRANSTTYNSGTIFKFTSGTTFAFYSVCASNSFAGGFTCVPGGGTCTTASSQPGGYGSSVRGTPFTDGTCGVQGSPDNISYFSRGSNNTIGSGQNASLNPGPGVIHDNYVDFTATINGDVSCPSGQSFLTPGLWGTVNGPAGTVAWSGYANNVDMVTGARVACANYP